MQDRSAIEAVAHAKCGYNIATFTRHLSRYSPLMDRPALLRLLCADEICAHSASFKGQSLHSYASYCPRCLLSMKHDATDRFM
jgi:hypothetical protein